MWLKKQQQYPNKIVFHTNMRAQQNEAQQPKDLKMYFWDRVN